MSTRGWRGGSGAHGAGEEQKGAWGRVGKDGPNEADGAISAAAEREA